MHYKITIKNYYRNGTINKNETTLYTIPIQESDVNNVLTDPTVSCELGKTGTFEFTINPNHPYYHSIAQMRTIMRVEYDGDTIFRGRILTIDNTLAGAKRIHCEGEMAFLLDSIQMSTVKETRKKITINAYINQVLNEHNRQMAEAGETDKKIYPGYIPGAYPSSFTSNQKIDNDKEAFGSDSAESTMDALETLVEQFGGFLRTRYSASDKKTYLDWCKHWFRDISRNGQPIAITKNIIDAQSNSEVDNIFTAVIPVGSKESTDIFITGYKTDIHGNNNRILVPQILKVFTDDQLNNGFVTKDIYEDAVNRYGIIYKIQKFPNADTKAKLWTYACDWIRNNYVGGITSYDLSAMDMHHVNNSVVKYLPGDKIKLTLHSDMIELDEYNPSESSNTVYRTLLSVKYVLHNPEKDSYSAGIPSDILNVEYGSKSTTKSKAASSGGGAAKKTGSPKPKDKKTKDRQEEREKASESLAWKIVWSERYNNKEYQALLNDKSPAAKLLVRPALQTSQIVTKMVLNDATIDTPKEAAEAVTAVLDGQKAKMTLTSPFLAATLSGKYHDPLSQQLYQANKKYQEATASLALDAGTKAMKLKGRTTTSANALLDKVAALNIPEDATPEEATSMIDDALVDVPTPNDIVSLTGNADSAGNEAGVFAMAKEAVTNMGFDSGGNGGTGTANIGNDGSSNGWMIRMNQALQYRDPTTGKTKTLPNGTIDAKDYSMLKQANGNNIPSFSTKLAVIDTLVSKSVFTEELTAVNGDISNLKTKVANIERLTADYADIKQLFTFTGGAVRFDVGVLSTNYIYARSFEFKGENVGTSVIKTGDDKYVEVLVIT